MISTVGLTADVLEATATYIETNGLYKGKVYPYRPQADRPDPPACTIGALGITSMRLDECGQYLLYGHAVTALRQQLNMQDYGIAVWSDAHEAWEVVEVLRTTAKGVRHGDIDIALRP